MLLAALPRHLQLNIFFLGHNEYFTLPVLRKMIKICRIIALNPLTDLINAMKIFAYVLKQKKSLCIFPEGERSIDGSIQPFKKGAGILAYELSKQVVPVYIVGTLKILPKGRFFPRLGPIKIIFGNPQSCEQLIKKGMELGAKDDYEAITKGIREEVVALSRII